MQTSTQVRNGRNTGDDTGNHVGNKRQKRQW